MWKPVDVPPPRFSLCPLRPLSLPAQLWHGVAFHLFSTPRSFVFAGCLYFCLAFLSHRFPCTVLIYFLCVLHLKRHTLSAEHGEGHSGSRIRGSRVSGIKNLSFMSMNVLCSGLCLLHRLPLWAFFTVFSQRCWFNLGLQPTCWLEKLKPKLTWDKRLPKK